MSRALSPLHFPCFLPARRRSNGAREMRSTKTFPLSTSGRRTSRRTTTDPGRRPIVVALAIRGEPKSNSCNSHHRSRLPPKIPATIRVRHRQTPSLPPTEPRPCLPSCRRNPKLQGKKTDAKLRLPSTPLVGCEVEEGYGGTDSLVGPVGHWVYMS